MGLCFSHGDASLAYSTFMAFRQMLVNSIDPEINIFQLFAQGDTHPLSKEPIFPFLMHSDCDGELSVEEMKQIIPQMKYIVTGWEFEDEESNESFCKHMGLELVKGMEEAVAKNEPLLFQ